MAPGHLVAGGTRVEHSVGPGLLLVVVIVVEEVEVVEVEVVEVEDVDMQ